MSPVCQDCGKGPRAVEESVCQNCGNEIGTTEITEEVD